MKKVFASVRKNKPQQDHGQARAHRGHNHKVAAQVPEQQLELENIDEQGGAPVGPEPKQAAQASALKLSGDASAESEGEEDVWPVELDDLDSVWVPPASRAFFATADVALSDDGELGLQLVYKRRRCRRRRFCAAQDVTFSPSGITLHGFCEERNPHVVDLAAAGILPIGATLAMFDGEIVQSPEHFLELVQQARRERLLRLRHLQQVAPEKAALLRFKVTLGFSLR
eukprot:INCI13585.1.p1 GENE.INCI13585.1~~INCI13585.1.p1  ORF type:complete len:227 (+),score=49.82 INCI13585.1:153-833(+)